MQEAIGPILGLLGNRVVVEPPVNIVLGMNRIQADGSTSDPDVEAAVLAKLDAVLQALRQPVVG